MADRYNKRRYEGEAGYGRGEYRGGQPLKRRRDEDSEEGLRPLLASVIRLCDVPQVWIAEPAALAAAVHRDMAQTSEPGSVCDQASQDESQEEELDHLYKALRRDIQFKGDVVSYLLMLLWLASLLLSVMLGIVIELKSGWHVGVPHHCRLCNGAVRENAGVRSPGRWAATVLACVACKVERAGS